MNIEITARDGSAIVPERIYLINEVAAMFDVEVRTVSAWINGPGLKDWNNGTQRLLRQTWCGGRLAVKGSALIEFAQATCKK